MSDVERAELKSKQRAILFYLMTAILILNAVIGFLPFPNDPDPVSPQIALGFWLLMVILIVINLLPIGKWGNSRFSGLLNDETTREHRRNSFAAGFWAALVCSSVLAIVASFRSITSVDVAKFVITAALAGALASFATQELRATR